jgi:hypothetical protein
MDPSNLKKFSHVKILLITDESVPFSLSLGRQEITL